MALERLTDRQLNRALLARQHLLKRTHGSVDAVVEHLVGLQAQEPGDPYVALFSRIANFDPGTLGRGIEERRLVRLTMMRGTIHLVTPRDAHALRLLLQPVLDRFMAGARRGFEGADPDRVAAEGRRILTREPLAYSALGKRLQATWPSCDPMALARIVQVRVPLVQVPPRGVLGKSGIAKHTPLDHWAPFKTDPSIRLEKLTIRYLAAFGPASVQDMQAWCGLTKLAAVFKGLEDELMRFESPSGVTLYDMPVAPRPPADTPAPPRFLPVYENLVLGFRDRSRVLSPKVRWPAIASNEIIRFVLIDGVLGASWRINREKARATLAIKPLVKLDKGDRKILVEEGERLLEMLEPAAPGHEVKVAAK